MSITSGRENFAATEARRRAITDEFAAGDSSV